MAVVFRDRYLPKTVVIEEGTCRLVQSYDHLQGVRYDAVFAMICDYCGASFESGDRQRRWCGPRVCSVEQQDRRRAQTRERVRRHREAQASQTTKVEPASTTQEGQGA